MACGDGTVARARRPSARRQARAERARCAGRPGARAPARASQSHDRPGAARRVRRACARSMAGDLDLGEALARVAPAADRRTRSRPAARARVGHAADAGGDRLPAAPRASTRPLAKLDDAVLRVLRMSAFQLLYLVAHSGVGGDQRRGRAHASCGQVERRRLVNAVLRALVARSRALTWPRAARCRGRSRRRVSRRSSTRIPPGWSRGGSIATARDATERWLEFNNHAAALCLAPNRHADHRATRSREELARRRRRDRAHARARHTACA